jgi:hypothetical protein
MKHYNERAIGFGRSIHYVGAYCPIKTNSYVNY